MILNFKTTVKVNCVHFTYSLMHDKNHQTLRIQSTKMSQYTFIDITDDFIRNEKKKKTLNSLTFNSFN